jgi:hypothetical protein
VKIQLGALGIIRKESEMLPNRQAAHWMLTPYGDAVMTRTAVIPSKLLGKLATEA